MLLSAQIDEARNREFAPLEQNERGVLYTVDPCSAVAKLP